MLQFQMDTKDRELQDEVREHYAAAALAVLQPAPSACCGAPVDSVAATLYTPDEQSELPPDAVLASLGCGNPIAVAELHLGERVLDLGSGGGIDVLLSARRVGPSGFVWGVDMTAEMLTLARSYAGKAGVHNVEVVEGTIERVPLPDASVDAVISNCVINLSVDKPRVFAEMFRLLRPGGRIGVTDVVAEDRLTPAERRELGTFSGCVAGALSRSEYLAELARAGFTEATVTFTHQKVEGMHSAIIRAVKPGETPSAQSR